MGGYTAQLLCCSLLCTAPVSGVSTRAKLHSLDVSWHGQQGRGWSSSCSKRAPEDSQEEPDSLAVPPSLPASFRMAERLFPSLERARSDRELGTNVVTPHRTHGPGPELLPPVPTCARGSTPRQVPSNPGLPPALQISLYSCPKDSSEAVSLLPLPLLGV